MKYFDQIVKLREELALEGVKSKMVGLVPTMGFLHSGHMALVKASIQGNDVTVVSIFVNPTQFNPNEDFSKYPRDIEKDLEKLESAKVDYVFIPNIKEMYNGKVNTVVSNKHLSKILIGGLRPGHFDGVTTVVTKLCNIIQPNRIYLGEKDYQQLIIIRQMISDLNMPIDVISVPTVREADGLAMSSRNIFLSQEDRIAARVLCKALDHAENHFMKKTSTVNQLKSLLKEIITQEPSARIDSIDIRDPVNLDMINGVINKGVVIMLVVRFGDVRLIDQRIL